MTARVGNAEDRFWTKVLMVDSCWEWIGHRATTGYGRMFYNGRETPAHRFAYELRRGPIPAGLEIDHLCRNRGCVNPDHLDPVTHRENCVRGTSPWAVNARKDLCPKGHEIDGRWRRARYCLTCHRDRSRVRRSLASGGERLETGTKP